MFNDEEPMYEPMPEFLEKIHELVTEEVKTGRVEMVKELEELRSTNSRLQSKIHELTRQVVSMDSEIKKKVEEARKEFEREMFGGFLVGDTFYYASFGYESTPCTVCAGLGTLSATLEDGTKLNMQCNGSECKKGKIQKGIYKVTEGKVEELSIRKERYNKTFINVYYSKGYGSNSSLDHKSCFKTKEDAQLSCDKKTEELRIEDMKRKSMGVIK